MKQRFLRFSRYRGDLHGIYDSVLIDFTPDSVTNLRLRKSDKLNFALNNEGNLYNNLINKVLDVMIKTSQNQSNLPKTQYQI